MDDLGDMFLFHEQCLSADVRKRLKTLIIEINWSIPPLHKLPPNPDHNRTKNQLNVLKFENVLQYAQFTVEDDDKLFVRWYKFCTMYGFDVDCIEPFISWDILSKWQKRMFGLFLAKPFPNRTVAEVSKRFQDLGCPNRKGKITVTEENLIRAFLKSNLSSTKYIGDLSRILRRDRKCIQRCVAETMINQDGKLNPQFYSGKELSYDSGIIKTILKKVFKCYNIKYLEFRKFSKNFWKYLQKYVQIPIPKLKHLWYTKLSTQICLKQPLFFNAMLIKLTHVLYELNVQIWSDVSWKCIAIQYFPGVSPYFLSYQFRKYVVSNVPCLAQLKLRACISYIYTNEIPKLYTNTFDKRLTRIRLENNEIIEY